MTDVYLSAAELKAVFTARSVSPVEYLDAVIEHIERTIRIGAEAREKSLIIGG